MSEAQARGAGEAALSGSAAVPSASARPRTAAAALADIDRGDQAAIIARLARRFSDLDIAEDAMQEAYAEALRTWDRTGVPRVPAAWLSTAASRKALDAVRRRAALDRALPRLRLQQAAEPSAEWAADPADLVGESEDPRVPDDRLGLFFACAHPELRAEDRLALTLRFVAGLSTSEVAHALMVSVPTMQQRIVRAKKRIRALGIRFEPPQRPHIAERLGAVQRVIYLIYAEGFARTAGSAHIRDDLTGEALRLGRILHQLLPGSAETTGLLALLLLTEARRAARLDADHRPVPLSDQDRRLWDAELIAEGTALAESAAASPRAGSYAVQAAIAAVHAEAPTFEDTDWPQIAVLYRLLESYQPGPVVRLGRAVAEGRAHGPRRGLGHLDELAADPALDRYRPFHVARAVTLEELEDYPAAAAAYRRALALPGNEAEADYLTAALSDLDAGAAAGGAPGRRRRSG